jgi:F-type H+-transporting ATPase subunit delta
MRNLAIGRRYAKALLMIGTEDGRAEAYGGELDELARLIDGQQKLQQAICNPLYDSAGRKGVLRSIIAKLQLSPVMRSFLLLLFEKGRFGLLNTINDYYQKLSDEVRGVARANLISARELSAETVEKVRQSLSNMTGKDVVLEFEQDPGLIGGLVTKIGDLVLDGSIKTQLLNLRETLKRGEGV